MTDQGLTRRQLFAAAAMATLATTGASADAPTAQGKVFDEAGGKGVAGVMVSNGTDVVLTDADGAWRLPIAPGDSVFVIKPAGWMVPVDPATMLPRFAYVHAPEGAMPFRFHGLAPTGPLPQNIDFPLRRQPEPANFDAILFTDPQPESLHEVGFIRDDVVAQAVGTQAAFGLTTGDLMFDDLSYYDRYNRIVGTIGLPWFSVPGNHDINYEAPDNTRSRDTFIRIFGARDYAFQYAGATFLMLDNVEYHGTDPAKPNAAGKYRGYFSPRQLTFVRNVLANVPPDALVVACFHIPLRTVVGTDPSFAAENAADFLAAIATHGNTISFSGHTHTNEHFHFPQPIGSHHHHVLAAVSGSWWSGPFDERGIPVALQADGCPNGFHILSVADGRASTRFVPARDPNRSQIRLVLDSQIHRDAIEVIRDYPPGALLTGPIAAEALASTRLVANFFDAGPTSTLEASFGAGTPFQPMTRTARTDPFVEEVFARNVATKKPWVQPVVSTHLWQLPLTDTLPPGTHRIAVRGTDEFGRAHTAAMVLEVTG
jgi:3',5'-cyclic AMP phosphodiesterase CpdA